MQEFLDQKATQQMFANLVGVSQQAISNQMHKGTLKDGGTIGEWLISYCENLRSEASGRGGDDQYNLTKARAEESVIKAANGRLDFNMKIGFAIVAEQGEAALNDWARFANREYTQGIHNLIGEIQSKHNVKIENELIDNVVTSTTERIRDYAKELGGELVARVKEFYTSENNAHAGMVGD